MYVCGGNKVCGLELSIYTSQDFINSTRLLRRWRPAAPRSKMKQIMDISPVWRRVLARVVINLLSAVLLRVENDGEVAAE
jgi:hypothetical protein